MWPKVSVIEVNYNSSRFMPVVLESLKSVASLDYPPDRYELVLVDNGSADGSFERIRDFLDKKERLRKKIIRLDRNLGFTGGNNIGFKARDKDSDYVLLLNNDAVLLQDGLKTLVEYAENRARRGRVAGRHPEVRNRAHRLRGGLQGRAPGVVPPRGAPRVPVDPPQAGVRFVRQRRLRALQNEGRRKVPRRQAFRGRVLLLRRRRRPRLDAVEPRLQINSYSGGCGVSCGKPNLWERFYPSLLVHKE